MNAPAMIVMILMPLAMIPLKILMTKVIQKIGRLKMSKKEMNRETKEEIDNLSN